LKKKVSTNYKSSIALFHDFPAFVDSIPNPSDTMCSVDLDPDSKMIFSEPILTTFIANIIFIVAKGLVAKIGVSLKSNHHKQI
jgi:hypothetical protein